MWIWDAADPHDRKVWAEWWAKWPEREVFAHPDYVRLYAGRRARALCAAASAGESCILYPFLLRSLGDEPYCDVSLRESTDITTPYGYGGPFCWGPAWSPDSVRTFWQEFEVWAAKAKVVSEVIRFSLFPESLIEYTGARRELMENVVRTLASEGRMWRTFEYKVRKNVNRARASGVKVVIDESGDCLDDFLAIYKSTMDRRNARKEYYFSRDYFERINSDLKGQFAYFCACVGNKLISAELVLVSTSRIYSFLGGTEADWFHARPNDLLKLEIMNWGHAVGKRQFVLGGGYSPGDGIYRYKLSFAPSGSVPFSIGARVLNPTAYEALIDARQRFADAHGETWHPDSGYFPAYRA